MKLKLPRLRRTKKPAPASRGVMTFSAPFRNGIVVSDGRTVKYIDIDGTVHDLKYGDAKEGPA